MAFDIDVIKRVYSEMSVKIGRILNNKSPWPARFFFLLFLFRFVVGNTDDSADEEAKGTCKVKPQGEHRRLL